VPLLAASLIVDCKGSAAKTKRRGERGSPCLTPLLLLKGLPETPFSRIAGEAELKTTLIQEIHFSEKPLLAMTCRITSCSIFIESLFEV